MEPKNFTETQVFKVVYLNKQSGCLYMEYVQVNAKAKNWHAQVTLLQKTSDLKGDIRKYFLETYALYEELFKILISSKAFYIRA